MLARAGLCMGMAMCMACWLSAGKGLQLGQGASACGLAAWVWLLHTGLQKQKLVSTAVHCYAGCWWQ